MRELGTLLGGLALVVLKMLLTIAGVVVAGIGLFTQNWPLLGIGVGLFVLGQAVHVLDQAQMDSQMQRWANEAIDRGPLPTRAERFQLLRAASAIEGARGDVRDGFKRACRTWSDEQVAARAEGRPPRPLNW